MVSMRIRPIVAGLTLGVAVFMTAGCIPASLVTASSVAGYAVTQERSTKDVLADNDIGITINGALLTESPSLFRRVAVDVKEGRVVLTGGVDTVTAKIRASELAWSVPGVVSVSNEIIPEQRASASRYANDVWISSQVRAFFIADQAIRSVNFTIDTHDAVVHLTGIALTTDEVQAATAAAARVPGVREVVSHVLTVNDPRRLVPAARPEPISPNTPPRRGGDPAAAAGATASGLQDPPA
jgi:osmotically-inducible protein OsmY